MQIPTLAPQMAPLSVRRELRFTLVRLRTLPWAKSYVTVYEGLCKTCEIHVADHAKLRDELEDGEAAVEHADSDLDEVALYLHKFIGAETSGEIRSSLHKALFAGMTPSKFVRPKLGDELALARNWPTILAGAPLAKLVAMGVTVTGVLKRCDTALQAHSTASANWAAFQLNTWAPFVAKVNGERQALGGEAKKQKRLDGSEGDLGLFRSLSKTRDKERVTLATVTEQIEQSSAELAELHQQKAELEAEAKAQALAEAERAQKEAELSALRKVQAEAEAKTKRLESELGLR